MKVLLHIVRFIVGVLFIFSGVVKLIDPIGSQYKFEEYFSEGVLNIEFLIPYALYFSIFLIVSEIFLGVAVLLGYKSKAIMKYLVIMIIFFLFLTWYSAYFNKVTDCGCFGDAIKLTPWQSFYKDVILTILSLFLYKNREKIHPYLSKEITTVVTIASFFISLIISIYIVRHLPPIDFRAYAIGKSIPEGMEYKNDGELPPVHDFFLENEQNDLAPQILKMEKVMLVIMSNLNKANYKGFPKVKEVADEAIKKGYKVYGVSASFTDIIETTKKQFNLPFEVLFCDETTLKTMIRSNPGIMILNKGTVIDKKSWRSLDGLKLK